MILVIDNYDSFSYNLVQLAGAINPEIKVIRNDEVSINEIKELNPSHIILSPGPGYPKDAGICKELIKKLAQEFPIFGVCLGHQAICEVYGAQINHAKHLMHGKKSKIILDNSSPIFKDLPINIDAARYHSLAARKDTIAEVLEIIAEDESGEVMAVQHKEYKVYGVQFHPESIMTPYGSEILRNFLLG